MPEISPREIIQSLGGFTKVAHMLQITVPSVHGWLKVGIPEGRLIQLAARLEVATNGAFNRRDQWPHAYQVIWPELVIEKVHE